MERWLRKSMCPATSNRGSVPGQLTPTRAGAWSGWGAHPGMGVPVVSASASPATKGFPHWQCRLVPSQPSSLVAHLRSSYSHLVVLSWALGTEQCSGQQSPALRGHPREASVYEMNAYVQLNVFSQVGHLGLASLGWLPRR